MHGKANRLINEKSPYLLQHAYNPVDWYPWGEEAFEKAKAEDKPIFLSIGYSTCHWCHVMGKESFEDEEAAEVLNDTFVCIKVDREERPDIDSVYMSVCQMMTGSGGWPLTIIMTGDKKPFFAATYLPKQSIGGRLGVIDLSLKIKRLWKENRNEILSAASSVSNKLKGLNPKNSEKDIGENEIQKAFSEFSHIFDDEYGGFGSPPKFPSPHNLMFLLRYYKFYNDKLALEMVEKTLNKMANGGIFDQIGFGFHRYSTDKRWIVPHYEKMLYDQGMLLMAYVESYKITGNCFYKDTAQNIIEYVMGYMKDENGGFYSSEDADSEGVEGKFYIWEKSELINCLTEEEAEIASKIFNIKDTGNFIDEFTGSYTFKNILYKNERELNELKNRIPNFEKEYERIRIKLLNYRDKRIRPFKDKKQLIDWNCIMISAIAKSAGIIDDEKLLKAAKQAMDFILKGRDEKGYLKHSFMDGQWRGTGNADDYAFAVMALLDLYEADFNSIYLNSAVELMEHMIKYFWDEADGGFYFTPSYGEKILDRKKEIYDGAIPSSNSAAFMNLIRLSRFTGNMNYVSMASKMMGLYAESIEYSPTAFSYFLCGAFAFTHPFSEVIIIGKSGEEDTDNMLKAVKKEFLPNAIVIFKDINGDKILEKTAGFLDDMGLFNDKATAYVCRNFSCQKPTNSVDEMLQNIR